MPRTAIAPIASFAAMGLFWGAWAALVPEVKRAIDAPDGPFGLALLAVGAGSLPAMVVTGRQWPRLGRWLLAAALVAFGISALLPLAAGTVLSLGLALLALGGSSGALDVAMNAEISELEAITGRRIMFAAHAFFSLGVLVASIATGLAREAGADRFAILPPVAVVFFLLALVAVGTRPRGRHIGEVPRTGQGQTSRGQAPGDRASRQGWILGLGLICCGAFLIEDAIQSWSALHLERTLGATPALGGAGPGIFAGAMFVGRSLGQLIGRHTTDRALVVGGGIGAALGTVLAAVAPVPLLALAGFGLAGASISIIAPALLARAGRLAGARRRGAAISTVTTMGYAGFLVGPGLVGAIAQTTSLPLALVAVAGLALLLAAGGRILLRDAGHGPVIAVGEELRSVSRG